MSSRLQGDIATASSSMLFLWSINGELLATVDSVDISLSLDQFPNVILSMAFSTVNFYLKLAHLPFFR
ncbi:unnamed protein product [Gongylonema pulchrum]|uniref:Transducin/WD40 repeat-like superfamily protein n=1 Tax=Gongylonema pulchrum TaxID=637853 RepID=A0A183DGM4_9BILA|nr:unnamed protein product [Gongylonema pulchrum]